MVDYEDYAALVEDYIDDNWNASNHDGDKPNIGLSKGRSKVQFGQVLVFDITETTDYTPYSTRQRHDKTIQQQLDLRIPRDRSRFFGCVKELERVLEVGQTAIKDHSVTNLTNNSNRMWFGNGRYHNNESAGRFRYVLDLDVEFIGYVRATS